MKLTAVEMHRVSLPLVSPFRTSFGTMHSKDVVLLRAVGPDGFGWGECVALSDPSYSSEYVEGAVAVLRDHLLPLLLAVGDVDARRVSEVLEPIRGHRMAKAAVEMAVLDLELRSTGTSFARFLGAVRDRVPSGVSVGIMESVPRLVATVGDYLDQGYQRIKLKIEPGWDVEPVRAVREAFGDDVLLQVDANAAYTLAEAHRLAALDPFDLLLLEQPLPEEDIAGHVALARRVATPICLDESITSAAIAADAIVRGACEIVNIKPGRVGGYLEAQRVATVAAAHGIGVWCGGMRETGIGRGANAALAACPEFTLPGDISASDRFYAVDVTPPFILENGHIAVPTSPGLSGDVSEDVLRDLDAHVEVVHP